MGGGLKMEEERGDVGGEGGVHTAIVPHDAHVSVINGSALQNLCFPDGSQTSQRCSASSSGSARLAVHMHVHSC